MKIRWHERETISYSSEQQRVVLESMESTSLTFDSQSLFPLAEEISHRRQLGTTTTITVDQIQLNRTPPLRLQFARRLSNFHLEGGDHLLSASRNRSSHNRGGAVFGDYYDGEDDDDDGEEEDDDRSLDLLVKFVGNVFKKISKRARRAVRSVLPITISTKLVGFSVNGVIILTFLWVLKAFLEVVCTLGSVVFTSILVIRGVWTGISYLQENRNHIGDELDDPAWSGARPAT